MANYTTDEDLAVYYARVELLQPTRDRHTQAAAEIDRRLRAKGYDSDDIAALSAQTKIDLKAASCYFVLAMSFQALDNAERAAEFQKLAVAALESTNIEDASGVKNQWGDDEVRLG
jgi:hypothetical protein